MSEIWTANQAQGWAGNPTQFGAASGVSSHSVDDPNAVDPLVAAMAPAWEPIKAVTQGTTFIRKNPNKYLPQQPRELKDAWDGRVSRSVFTPYFNRLIRTAVGLILRKPVTLDGGDQEFWADWRLDVDRQGTDLEEFLRRQLAVSIAYGHSAWLTDFPSTEGIVTLKDQAEAQLKPYFIDVTPWQILGWRHDIRLNGGALQQVRIKENAAKPDGKYGIKYVEQIRILEPGSYELWEDTETTGWEIIDQGKTSLKEIPLAVTYAGKMATLYSAPPMADIAQLNLAYYQRHADLIHALHIAAQPILVLKGWDETSDPIGLSVNNALAMGTDSDAKYVEPASSAFDAQRAELEALEHQISQLGIAQLMQQKNSAESGLSKSIDKIDSNSMLALISKDIESTLQVAINWAAEFAGIEPPSVTLDRDFDAEAMESQQITSINTLFTSGLIDQETALRLLQKGEVLPEDYEIDEIMAETEAKEGEELEMEMAKHEQQSEISAAYAPDKAVPKPKPPKAK